MSSRNTALTDTGRHARFTPVWWLLPGVVVSAMAWAGAFWLFTR
jgi:hypothetical protein